MAWRSRGWGYYNNKDSKGRAKPHKWIFMKAKYAGKCTETGNPIDQGDAVLFEATKKEIYCSESNRYNNQIN